MRRRFLPLAAAFSMMAAAADEQQAVAARESSPAPNGERFDAEAKPPIAAPGMPEPAAERQASPAA